MMSNGTPPCSSLLDGSRRINITEPVIDPEQIIVDSHHHLYDRPHLRYLFDEILEDVSLGHDIRATVYVQARAMLREGGPEEFMALGETEFANGIAAMSASGAYGTSRICAGIVGAADLCLGASVRPVLEAHLTAAGASNFSDGRFRGIRHVAAWDKDWTLLNPAYQSHEHMLASNSFREGFAELAPLSLSFDAWLFFHQIPHLTALARAFPETPIVLNHCGGILGVGAYAGRSDEVFKLWSFALKELSKTPNVMVKLGGLGMQISGMNFEPDAQIPASQQLAEKWRPWFETCIELFGTERCMFESNFPADKSNHSYKVGWNAMKRIASSATADEKADLFWRSASRFYRLPVGSLCKK